MAALSSPYDARRKDGALLASAVAAGARVFKGGLLTVASATGLAQSGADALPDRCSPESLTKARTTQAARRARKAVRILKTGVFTYAKTGAAQTDVGKTVFLVDDNTVSTAATADNIACGVVVGVPDTAHVQIRIDGKVN